MWVMILKRMDRARQARPAAALSMPFMWVMILKLSFSISTSLPLEHTFNALYVGDDFETRQVRRF